MTYAVYYFIHYPSIRIGNNPPTFYALSSLWALITADTIQAALVLSAILGAIFCMLAFWWSSRVLGVVAGIIIAVTIAFLPTFIKVVGSFLIDIPIGIFSLAAAVNYAAFIYKGTLKPAILFSLFAVLALSIKLSALFLAVMVVLAIIISGKFSLLRNKYFWLPAPIIAISVLPWYLFTMETSMGGTTERDLAYPLVSFIGYLKIIVSNITIPGAVLFVIGTISRLNFIRRNRGSQEAAHWSVIIALFWAVILFQIITPANILQRYMITAFAPALMLVWAGAMVAGDYIVKIQDRYKFFSEDVAAKIPLGIFAAILTIILIPALQSERLPGNQMGVVAQKVAESLPANNPVVVVASDGSREESFIAQLAQLDRARPSMFAIRASRILGKEEGFMAADYQQKFNSPEEVLAELERLSIAMVVLDRAQKAQQWRHNRDIAWLVDNRPELWQRVWSLDNPGKDGVLSLYILKSAAAKSVDLPFYRKEFRPNSGNIGVAEK